MIGFKSVLQMFKVGPGHLVHMRLCKVQAIIVECDILWILGQSCAKTPTSIGHYPKGILDHSAGMIESVANPRS